MVNFYCCFLPNCAQVWKPLTDQLKGGAKTLEWTSSAQEAFQNAERLLAEVVFIHHWRPLSFFSRKLTDTESGYSTFDHELLAAQAAIKHFRHFCKGQFFQLWTDHKPLVIALSHVSVTISHRQQRHLAFISEFNVQLLYLPGLKNVFADFYPPPPESAGTVAAMAAADPVDFEEMAAEQNHCAETQCCLGSTCLKLAFRQAGTQRLAGDVSTGVFRPIVPLKFRKAIFDHFHNVAHPGRLAHVVLFHPGLCGTDFPATSPPGPAGAWPASGARSTTTHACPPSPSPSRSDFFLIFMLIWWARYNTVIILIIFSPSLIAHPNGWKLFPLQIHLRRHAQRL
jgi:hypothetical protein